MQVNLHNNTRTTNEGGPVDAEADLHEAAVTEEENLGPNAPGYIP
jgi:hypothetical protein